MKIYITKPPHTKYGSIKLSTYKSIEDLIDNSSFWFDKPTFNKPLICIFMQEFFWRGFYSGLNGCDGKIKYFPEGVVKEELKRIVRNSINEYFYESLENRHYKWIGQIDVELVEKSNSGNFNLYLTKPSACDIRIAGMDRSILWLSLPMLMTCNYDDKYTHNFFNSNVGISGKFFRKNKDVKDIGIKFWDAIVNSFNIEFSNMNEFYNKIDDNNHKDGMSSSEFIKEFHFDINLKGGV